MKRLSIICCLLLVSIIMFSFVACSPNVSEASSAKSVITEYINTYYTITKDDLELYKRIMGGNKDINVLLSDADKANKEFKNLMTDTAYAAIVADRMSYLRCDVASKDSYMVDVTSVKLEKDSENAQTKTYFYDIELKQTSTAGNTTRNIKERKKINVSKIKDSWKVSNTYGY